MFFILKIFEEIFLKTCKPNRDQKSDFPIDIISFDDVTLFPPEPGPIQKSKYPEIRIPRCRVDQFVWQNVELWKDKTAIICTETGKRFTYAQLRAKCGSFAVSVQEFGLKKDDVVGICLMNCPEFVIAALGTLEAGCIFSPFNPAYTVEEISYKIIKSDPKIVVCLTGNYDTVQKAIKMANKKITIICGSTHQAIPIPAGAINFNSWTDSSIFNSKSVKNYEDFDPNDTATIPFSSGTTGLPKGVMLSHRNLISGCHFYALDTTKHSLAMKRGEQEVILILLPIFHSFSFLIVNMNLRIGNQIVISSKFTPNSFIETLQKYQITYLPVAPPTVIFLGQSPLVKPEHLKSVQRMFCGAAPLGPVDAQKVLEKAPHIKFSQPYGMTETCGVTLTDPVPEVTNVGYLLHATQAKCVAVDDPEMKPLGPNEPGELLFRGPQTFKGYLNNEKATKETIIKNRWVRTGDIGYYDVKGQFYITDRLKEIIKVKGFQVAPAELEETLRSYEGIFEAAVVGVLDEKSGEVPRAFVVPKAGVEIDEKKVLEFLATKLIRYKIPDKIVIVESIPKSASGKILRREIKKKYGLN